MYSPLGCLTNQMGRVEARGYVRVNLKYTLGSPNRPRKKGYMEHYSIYQFNKHFVNDNTLWGGQAQGLQKLGSEIQVGRKRCIVRSISNQAQSADMFCRLLFYIAL